MTVSVTSKISPDVIETTYLLQKISITLLKKTTYFRFWNPLPKKWGKEQFKKFLYMGKLWNANILFRDQRQDDQTLGVLFPVILKRQCNQ